MLPQQRKKNTKKRIRFAGIGAAAAKLEVNRIHLYRVLKGERHSPLLLKRARALMAKKKAAAK
jgi:hypothetical protein